MGMEVVFCSDMLELCSLSSGLRLPRDRDCQKMSRCDSPLTGLKLLLVECVGTKKVRQGDERLERRVTSFAASGVV